MGDRTDVPGHGRDVALFRRDVDRTAILAIVGVASLVGLVEDIADIL